MKASQLNILYNINIKFVFFPKNIYRFLNIQNNIHKIVISFMLRHCNQIHAL